MDKEDILEFVRDHENWFHVKWFIIVYWHGWVPYVNSPYVNSPLHWTFYKAIDRTLYLERKYGK